MALVSYKNIHIRLSCDQKWCVCPYFGHNSAIFMGAQDIVIYRLVLRNLNYDAQFSFSCFWATFGEEMGGAKTRVPKVCSLDGPFGPTTILKLYFRHFQF